MPEIVVVTGATGWIGASVCQSLKQHGFAVRACVRGDESRWAFLKALGCDTVQVDDVTSRAQLIKAFEGADFVAAVANPMPSTSDFSDEEFVAQSVALVNTTFDAALACGVKKIVLTASMASICGTQAEKDPKHLWCETDFNDQMGSKYSKAKTLAERAAWDFVKAHPEMALSTIHPAVVFGPVVPGQPPRSTNAYPLKMVNGEYKDGVPASRYGVADARDVGDAHALTLKDRSSDGQRYLVAIDDQYTSLEVSLKIRELFPEHGKLAPENCVDPSYPKTGRKPTANNAKIVAFLGRPLRTFTETMKDTVQSFIDAKLF